MMDVRLASIFDAVCERMNVSVETSSIEELSLAMEETMHSNTAYISFKDWAQLGEICGTDDLELSEVFDINTVPNIRKNSADLFLGRLQPIHQGHINIIKQMNNPVVVLVKGSKSSKDKQRNPLDLEDQSTLLRKVFPRIKIVVAPNGYLPEIFANLREIGVEVSKVFAGEDRIAGYKKQIDSVNNKLESDREFNVEFKQTDRFAFATEVRQAIRDDDYDKYKKLMPKQLWNEYAFLRTKIN